MGYTTSTVHGIQVPNSAQANNVPTDLGLIVTALESGSLVKRLTGAQIAALSGAQKPAGLVVYNTTTGKLQISNGSTFSDIDTSSRYAAWTPTVTASTTNPTGVTTEVARYSRTGNTVHAYAQLTIPSGTKGSGTYSISLPVAATTGQVDLSLGTSGSPVGWVVLATTTTAKVYKHNASTSPSAFASTDISTDTIVSINVTYEAA